MPTGEVYLLLKDGTKDSIEMSDLSNPKKEIMEDEWILQYIKKIGYNNVDVIVYERDNYIVQISMADYYAEHGQELEG
jgi:cupin superfamily acireductone dioxygenase involved in methionine salvage